MNKSCKVKYKKHSRRWNENIGKGLKGKPKSKEHIENLCKALKGRKARNKGLTLEEEFGIKKANKIKKLISNHTKETMNDPEVKIKCGWSKGLTKETSVKVKHCADSRKGIVPRNKGLTLEEEFGVGRAKKIKEQIKNSMKEAFEKDPTLREKCRLGRLGKTSPMKDKKYTPEARENIKKGMANRDPKAKEEWIKSLSGENNSNWKGGISYMPYGFKFDNKTKERIRERDGNTCRLCFMTNEEHKEKFSDSLHCHHIDHDKQNCRETNLITLCNKCNAIVNINSEYWTKYFQIKLSVIDEQSYLMELYANN